MLWPVAPCLTACACMMLGAGLVKHGGTRYGPPDRCAGRWVNTLSKRANIVADIRPLCKHVLSRKLDSAAACLSTEA